MQRRAAFKVVFRCRFVVRPVFFQRSCKLVVQTRKEEVVVVGWRDVHLLSAENQSLLDRRDAFFLFDAFLYSGDLYPFQHEVCFPFGWN